VCTPRGLPRDSCPAARLSRQRRHGLTPQQYQLLLALKGYPGHDWATVRELADQLQLRHHSVVGAGSSSVYLTPTGARAVRVLLAREGDDVLARLAALRRDELRRMNAAALMPATWIDTP
jgi:DNA-binding MarR family transcriptional regulator